MDRTIWSGIREHGKTQIHGMLELKSVVIKQPYIYNVHVYGMIDGVQKFIGESTFTVSNPKGTVEVKNYNSAKGTFDVVVKNISSKSGVQAVQVPVWSQANQSDIVWYAASRVATEPIRQK